VNILEALANLGLHLFPVDHPELPRCVGRHAPDRPCDGTRGKHPEPWSWSKASTADAPRLAQAFVLAASKALGISASHGYALAQRNAFPVQMIKIGGAYRVITAALIQFLEGDAA
jgi:hypothetical protein